MARRSFPSFFSVSLLFLLFTYPGVQARAASSPDLIVHGTADHLWLAHIARDSTQTIPGFATRLMGRQIGQPWQVLGMLQGRVAALASRGTDLAVLFAGGDWSLFWMSNGILTSTMGQPLPLKGRIITFASDSRTLWAIARADAGATTTRPAGASSGPPAATQATTAPTEELILLSLNFKQWKWVNHGALPRDIRPVGGQQLVLGVVNHDPVLAVEGPKDEIRVARFVTTAAATRPADQHAQAGAVSATRPSTARSAEAGWSGMSTVVPAFQVDDFEVLGDSERPGSVLLWVAPKTGPGVLYEKSGENWGPPVALEGGDALKSASQRAIALAAERLRMVWQQGDPPALYARQFDLKGKPVGEAAVVGSPADRYGQIEFYLEILMMGALVAAVIGTFYRRRQPPTALPPDRLPLAPLSARFGAGIIDGLPIVASIVAAAMLLDGRATFTTANLDPRVNWILSGGFFVYLIYTTVMEVVFGRTVGKMILGLRVVSVDGQPADWSALLMRNILRVIDFLLAWFPLALIFYTPLRQRIGDMAAATVVVTQAAIAGVEDKKEQGDAPSDADKDESAAK
jgi:uncharacterized RDD family membrane protein YckC